MKIRMLAGLMCGVLVLSGCWDGSSREDPISSSLEPEIVFGSDHYECEVGQAVRLDYTIENYSGTRYTKDYTFTLSNNTANAEVKWIEDPDKWNKYNAHITGSDIGECDLVVTFLRWSSAPVHFIFDDSTEYTVSFYDKNNELIQTSSQTWREPVSVPSTLGGDFICWYDGNDFCDLGDTTTERRNVAYRAIHGTAEATDGLKFSEDGDHYSVSGYSGTDYEIVIPAIYNGKLVTSIADSAFKNKAIEEVVLPSTIRTIGNYAFSSTNLKAADLESSILLSLIGSDAFSSCGNLETILIPQSVRSVGSRAFSGCSKLTILFKSESSEGIKLNGSYSSSWNASDRPYYFNIKRYVLGSEYSYAVQNDSTILFLKYFGGGVFHDTEIEEMPITMYGYRCFWKSLVQEVTISSEAHFMDSCVFEDCANLTSVIFEKTSSMKTIGASAFLNCSSLRSILLPISIESIGSACFKGCSKLSIFFEAPSSDGIKLNGSYSSSWNASDRPYYFGVITNLKKDATGQFEYIEYNDGKVGLVKYIPLGDRESVDATMIDGKEVKSILISAFENTSVYDVICGPALESIRGSAFRGCKKLKEVNLSDCSNLKEIYSYAFEGCENLNYIFIPKSVKSIGGYAFDNCSSLTILFNVMDASEISLSSYWNADSRRTVFNVKQVFQKYINVNGSLICYESNRKEVGVLSYRGGTRYTDLFGNVSVNGPDTDLDLTKINGMPVVEICDGAFRDLYALTGSATFVTFTFGKTIKRIGNSAFRNLYNGDARAFKVVFEEGSVLETIGSYAFCGHYATGVVVPASIKTIGNYAFGLSSWLKSSVIYMESKDKSNISLGSYWNGNQTVYWGNDWEYVNGVPTLK